MCLQCIPNILGLTKKGLAFDDKLKLLEAAGAKVRGTWKKHTEEKRVMIISNLQVFYLKDVAEMSVDGMERYSCSASKRQLFFAAL